MRRRLTCIVAATLFLQSGIPTWAADKGYSFANNTAFVDKLVVGPGSVFFVGINPYRYPFWTATIDDKFVPGTAPSVGTAYSGSPIGNSDPNFPSAPTPVPSTDPFGLLISDATPAPHKAELDACDLKPDASRDSAKACSEKIRDELAALKNMVPAQEERLEAARTQYGTLYSYADKIIADSGVISDAAAFERYQARIRNELLDSMVRNFSDRVQALPDWQDWLFTDASAQSDKLTAYYDSQTATNQALIDKNDTIASDLATARDHLVQIQKTLTDEAAKHVTPTPYIVQQRDDLSKQIQRLLKQINVNTLRADIGAIAKLRAEAKKNQGALADFDPKADRALLYKRKLANIREILRTRVRPARADRFGFSDRNDCKGLNSGGREKLYVVALGDGRVSQVRVVCQARMFLSAGFAFSGLAQPTYGVINGPAPNVVTTAPPVAPGATAVPAPSAAPSPTILTATTNNSLRATVTVLNNIRISNPDADNGLYASFGLGISNTSTTPDVDYMAGLSWSISRTFLITVGAQYGKQIDLPSPYFPGEILPAGSNPPPTVTSYKTKLFLGFTFGRQ